MFKKNQHHREPIFRGRIGSMVMKIIAMTLLYHRRKKTKHVIIFYLFFTHSFQNTDVTFI